MPLSRRLQATSYVVTGRSRCPDACGVGTVVFAGAHAVQSAFEDLDGDGDLDLVLHFRTQDTKLRDLYAQLLAEADQTADGILETSVPTHQEASLSLTGSTMHDRSFEGFDILDLFLAGKELRSLLEELATAALI